MIGEAVECIFLHLGALETPSMCTAIITYEYVNILRVGCLHHRVPLLIRDPHIP